MEFLTFSDGPILAIGAINLNSSHYGDFNNDGRSEILFQNFADGAVALWTTNTAGVATGVVPLGTLPAGFHIDGTGNFNSTLGEDILARNNATNQIGIWSTAPRSAVSR